MKIRNNSIGLIKYNGFFLIKNQFFHLISKNKINVYYNRLYFVNKTFNLTSSFVSFCDFFLKKNKKEINFIPLINILIYKLG